jgi:hypothetical protein
MPPPEPPNPPPAPPKSDMVGELVLMGDYRRILVLMGDTIAVDYRRWQTNIQLYT